MADENKKQTAILESVLGELRKSNAMKREESGGDALVGGIPFGSAQFTDDIDKGFKALGKDNTESLDKVGGQLKENSEATESNASADEEDQRDKTNIFKKMTASLQGIGASLKDKAVNITKGLFGKIPFGTLFGLGIMALISFLDSKEWMMIGKWVEDTIEFLKKLWMNVLKPILSKLANFALDTAAFIADPSWENTKKLLGDNKAVLGTLLGLLAVKSFGISGIVTGIKKVSTLLGSKFGEAGLLGAKTGLGKLVGIGGLAVSVAIAINNAIDAVAKAEDWKVSEISAGIGGFLGGTESGWMNAFRNGGTYAIGGASAGFLMGGPVGALIGGLGGFALGAIFGYFGGEKIAQGVDSMGKWIAKTWDSVLESIGSFVENALLNIKSFLGFATEEEERKIIEDKIKANEKALATAKKVESDYRDAVEESPMVKRHLAEGKKGSRSFMNRQMVKNIPAAQNKINEERVERLAVENQQLKIDLQDLKKKQEEDKKQLKLEQDQVAEQMKLPKSGGRLFERLGQGRGITNITDGSVSVIKKDNTTVVLEDMYNPNAFNTAGLQHLHNPHLR